MKKISKKLITTLTASMLLVSGTTVAIAKTPSSSTNESEKVHYEYSGEEIFSAYVLGQGTLAKKLNNIYSNKNLKILNSKENKEFSKLLIERIKKEDPNFFNEFQKAIYTKDALKVDELLLKSGDIMSKDVEMVEKGLENTQMAGARSGFETQTKSYLYYYYIALVGVVVLAILSQIDATPVTQDDDFDRESGVRSLIDTVN